MIDLMVEDGVRKVLLSAVSKSGSGHVSIPEYKRCRHLERNFILTNLVISELLKGQSKFEMRSNCPVEVTNILLQQGMEM